MQLIAEYIRWDEMNDVLERNGLRAATDAEHLFENANYDEIGDSTIFNGDVGELFAAMRPRLDDATASPLEDFLPTIVLNHGQPTLWEDSPLVEDDLTVSVMSPQRAAAIYKRASEIAFDKIAPVAEEALKSVEFSVIESANEFVEYIQQWLRVFEKATTSGRGLRLLMH